MQIRQELVECINYTSEISEVIAENLCGTVKVCKDEMTGHDIDFSFFFEKQTLYVNSCFQNGDNERLCCRQIDDVQTFDGSVYLISDGYIVMRIPYQVWRGMHSLEK